MMNKTKALVALMLFACLVVIVGCAPPENQQGGGAVPTLAESAVVEADLEPVVVEITEEAAEVAETSDETAVVAESTEDNAEAVAEDVVEDAPLAQDENTAMSDDGMAAVVAPSDGGECPSGNFLNVTAHPNNSEYAAPTLSVTCTDTTMEIASNSITSFEFIAMTPGNLQAIDKTFTIPLNPQIADTATEIPLLGTVAVVVDGLPIYGPNEGGNLGFGDPYLDQILDFCNGHIGPDGYHYHARPDCLFDNVEQVGLVIGYALDGFPILSPYVCTDASCTSMEKLQSSWQKTSDAEAAWEAHEYVSGSGDLDRCNGRVLSDGSYAYFATDSFPYLLGCYTGTPLFSGGGGGGAPQGGGEGGGPPQGGGAPEPDYAGAAATLGISEDALRDALGGSLPPDFEGASAILGISEDALREALPPPGR